MEATSLCNDLLALQEDIWTTVLEIHRRYGMPCPSKDMASVICKTLQEVAGPLNQKVLKEELQVNAHNEAQLLSMIEQSLVPVDHFFSSISSSRIRIRTGGMAGAGDRHSDWTQWWSIKVVYVVVSCKHEAKRYIRTKIVCPQLTVDTFNVSRRYKCERMFSRKNAVNFYRMLNLIVDYICNFGSVDPEVELPRDDLQSRAIDGFDRCMQETRAKVTPAFCSELRAEAILHPEAHPETGIFDIE